MKDVSSEYEAKEKHKQRKPREIYHIWRRDESQNWYYTDGDKGVTFSGDFYDPAPGLSRTPSKYNANMDVTQMDISSNYLLEPTVEFLAINPIELLWISVMKLHEGMDPLEADVVFIGQIKSVGFKGLGAVATCVGFEHFLKKTVPSWRYQLNCNHDVFDTCCGLDSALYTVTDTITMDATKTVLTASDFGTKADGYFIGGKVQHGNDFRTIVEHVGTSITIMYRMLDLNDGDSVTAFPGCDGRRETCKVKYDNLLNNLAMSDIPLENPATRVSW